MEELHTFLIFLHLFLLFYFATFLLISNAVKCLYNFTLISMTDNSRTYLRSFAVYAAGFGVLCVFVFFGLVHPVFAQTDFLQTSADASGLPQTNIILIIARLIRAFLGILGIIFVLLVLYAGFLYMTSQGEAAKTEKAKKMISQAVIGMLIIFSSYAIASFVINAIVGATSGQIVSKR